MPEGNKNKTKREKLLSQKVIFCTECGAELENYCFEKGPDDVEAIKKNLAQCRKSGKYAGEFCSKLFIAGSDDLGGIFGNEET